MAGTLAATGEIIDGESAEAGARFEVDAVDVIEVADGELTAKHTYLDSQALLRQIGG
jgi:ketosteroid isomerase-like protein